MDIETIERIAKRRGFIYPSSEIYGGLAGFYDYGHLGTLMKNKIENFWREFFLKNDNIFEISSRTIVHEKVWEASGHLKDFIDPITQCQKCKKMFRADDLIQEQTGKFVEGLKAPELTKLIKENKVKCPKCKGDLSEVRIFNLMSKTFVGPVEGNIAYLRPETAQGIFTNFSFISKSARAKLPFGIAQIGVSYRNEISPRQWIIRLREFNQMEIEMFVNPKKINDCPNFSKIANKKLKIFTREEQKKNGKPIELTPEDSVKKKIVPNKWMAYFLAKQLEWYQKLGIPLEALRHRNMLPEETPHYSKGNFDLEIKFDFGWKEVVGNAYRTDFDLSTHQKHSGKDMGIVDNNEKVIPHVIEPSFGMERTLYGVLLYCFVEDKKRGWDWFRFPPKIAPYTVGVFPLVNKDGLDDKAKEIYEMLKKNFDVFYDDSGSIGRRYARADEIGTPFAITIDYDTMKDDTVTIRNRDTTKQERVKIKDLVNFICEKFK
jgi:glycyl-tRNA synthetase